MKIHTLTLEEGAVLISLRKEIHQNIPLQMAAKKGDQASILRVGVTVRMDERKNHSIITIATTTGEGEIA